MPIKIPPRNIKDYQQDCPLTMLGSLTSSLIGEAMKNSDIQIDMVFSSPSLRCVQTLTQVLKGFKSNLPIKIEPGFMEWVAWYPNGLPTWMTPEELLNAGYNVDTSYKPILKVNELPLKETAAQYYDRSHSLIKNVIENTKGNILIVAHAISLAACTKQLMGGQSHSAQQIPRLVQQIPYLACVMIKGTDSSWDFHPTPFPPITHGSNKRFDWKILT